MKRCPQCNRAYSDIAEKCPQCNIPLPGNPGASPVQTNNTWTTQSPSQPYGTQLGPGYSYQRNNQPPYNQQHNQMQYNGGNNNGGTGYIPQPTSSMKFTEAVKTCFMKYVTFRSRARRSEYWYFELFSWIGRILLFFLSPVSEFMALAFMAWSWGVLLPEWAVYIRRLHDTGKDWTFIFWAVVPIYGQIKILIELAKDSDPGNNAYGPCPK